MTTINPNRRAPSASPGDEWSQIQVLQQEICARNQHLSAIQGEQVALQTEQAALEIQIRCRKQQFEQFSEIYAEPAANQQLQAHMGELKHRLQEMHHQLLDKDTEQQVLQTHQSAAARQLHQLVGYTHQSDAFLARLPDNFEMDYVYPRKLRHKPTPWLQKIAEVASVIAIPLGACLAVAGSLSLAVFLFSGLVGLWALVAVKESL